MYRSLLLISLFLSFLSSSFAETIQQRHEEREKTSFIKPSGWIDNPVKDKSAKSFYTNNDPARSLLILARTIYVSNQTAYEWAIDEVKDLTPKIKKITQPQSVNIGGLDWVVIEWEGQRGNVNAKGRQYYSKKDSKYTLIEVAAMGPKEVFDTAGTKEIYDFLSNVKIESRSFDELKKDGFQNELEKKSRPASSADIVGVWEMLYQKYGSHFSADDPFVIPYQRFNFLADGHLKSIGSNAPFDDEKTLRIIWEAAPVSTTYEILEPGVVIIGDSIGKYTAVISLITDDLIELQWPDAPKLKKGDLAVAYVNPEKQVYLQRHLRKVGNGEKNNYNDIIIFKTGKSIEGKIIERTNEYIKIDFFGAPITYYFDEIQSINGKSPILAAKKTEILPVNMPDSESLIDESMSETEKSMRIKPVGELPFSTAVITYKYKGSHVGKETVYIDAVNNKIAQEVETSGSLMGRALSKREKNIYDGKMFYHINLEKGGGTKEEWRGNCVTAVFKENKYLDYYSGSGSFLGKVCKVYKPTFGTAYFWNGIILKEEITNHQFGKEFNYTREAVDIQLDAVISPDKFKVPAGIKLMTGEEMVGEMKKMFEEMKSKIKK